MEPGAIEKWVFGDYFKVLPPVPEGSTLIPEKTQFTMCVCHSFVSVAALK